MVSGSPCPLISFINVSFSVIFVVRGQRPRRGQWPMVPPQGNFHFFLNQLRGSCSTGRASESWELGEPQSQRGGPQGQLVGPQSQPGGPQSQLGGPGGRRKKKREKQSVTSVWYHRSSSPTGPLPKKQAALARPCIPSVAFIETFLRSLFFSRFFFSSGVDIIGASIQKS